METLNFQTYQFWKFLMKKTAFSDLVLARWKMSIYLNSRKLVVQRDFLLLRRGAMAGPSLLFLPDKWWLQLPEGKCFGPLPDSNQNRHPSCTAQCPMGMDMWSNMCPGSKMGGCLRHRSQQWLLTPQASLCLLTLQESCSFLHFSHIPCQVLSSLSSHR